MKSRRNWTYGPSGSAESIAYGVPGPLHAVERAVRVLTELLRHQRGAAGLAEPGYGRVDRGADEFRGQMLGTLHVRDKQSLGAGVVIQCGHQVLLPCGRGGFLQPA